MGTKKLWIVTIETHAVALADDEHEAIQAVVQNIRDILDEPQTEVYARAVQARSDVASTGYTLDSLPWVAGYGGEDVTIGALMDGLDLPQKRGAAVTAAREVE